MKNMILNQIYSTKKNFLISIFLVLSLNICNVFSILNDGKLNKVKVTSVDFFIKLYGGIEGEFYLFQYIQWIIIIGIILLIIESIISSYSELDSMIITRAGFRLKWWISKITSLMILNIIYVMVIIGINKILSTLFLYSSNYKNWSDYSKIYYVNLYNSTISPYKIVVICFATMLTGFMAISTLFQIINEITNSNIKILISCVVIMIINSILYTNNLIPRVISTLNYPSILDITPDIRSYINNIFLNIVLIMINTTVGSIIIIKKDILGMRR